ncbi:hypothetical protein ACRQFN_02200 [Actinotignum sp. GS-2025e]|uniref:hypothetical protein n=1 Tax=unclassified Actinotignum TaxID=2632702 RepID=UPI003F48C925
MALPPNWIIQEARLHLLAEIYRYLEKQIKHYCDQESAARTEHERLLARKRTHPDAVSKETMDDATYEKQFYAIWKEAYIDIEGEIGRKFSKKSPSLDELLTARKAQKQQWLLQ